MKKVSVIIPAYNSEKFILQAIESVSNQTYPNIEIIVVDDGSTDGTRKLLTQININNKIKYYWKQNGGISTARNFGLKHATGDYIAFLDADDEFFPKKIELQISYFDEHLNAMMTHTDYIVIDEDGNNLGYRRTNFYQGYKYPEILMNWHGPAAPSTWVFRRAVFDEIGIFLVRARKTLDLNFIVRYARKYSFHQIPEGLMRRRVHSKNISNNQYKNVENWLEHFSYAFQVDQDLSPTFKKRVYARMYANAALMSFRLSTGKDMAQLRYYAKSSLNYWPFEWQAYIALISSFIPNFFREILLSAWSNYKHRENV